MVGVAPDPTAHPDRASPGFTPEPAWVPPAPSLAEVLAGAASGAGMAIARPLLGEVLVPSLGRRPGGPARSSGGGGPAGPPPMPASLATAIADDAAAADPGWFGPGSTAWKVQADASMFVAGVGAFALQLLHPLALAGVTDHGRFAEDFVGRIVATGAFVQGVTFGGQAEASTRIRGVEQVHTRVLGSAPDGRPYSASDPDLLRWVHLGEYLAIAAAYRRFGAHPLSVAELDRYVGEVAVVAEALGVPDPPRSWPELDAAVQRYRTGLAVGEQTVTALHFLARPPGLAPAARPAWRLLWAGGLACVPPWALRLLRVRRPSPAELVACRALVRGLDTLLGEPPPLAAARKRLSPASGTSAPGGDAIQ